MNKLVFLTICLFLSGGVYSQGIDFGVKAGLNLANFRGDDPDTDIKPGLYAGGFVEFQVSDVFAIQSEIYYSQQGAKDDNRREEANFKIDYLNIPVMAKFYMYEDFSMLLGPQLGILLKSDIEKGDLTVDYKDETKNIDFAMGLGLEYELELGLLLNVRYNFSFTKVDDPSDSKHAVFQFGAAFKF